MTSQRRPASGSGRPPIRSGGAPRWVRGPEWGSHGLRQPGWVLLPLRGFLGVTFTFAALQKLSNPDFFNSQSPTSVQHQMQMVAPSSPIGPLVTLSLHAGWLVGLVIALGELAVGIGTLLGLKARLAAVGGALLALSFFLTVSWNTSPYYYGADIVFLFAWTPFIAVGSAGVLSLDGLLAERAESRAARTRPRQAEDEESAVSGRRAVLAIGAAAAVLGGLTALLGRLAGGSAASQAGPKLPQPTPSGKTTPGHSPKSPGNGRPAPAGMSPVTALDKVPVGQGVQFQDATTGGPAWLVRLGRNDVAAFSAICTHLGCTVGYDAGATEFICPCHGGTYSARTGKVLAGPPPAPLARIQVQVEAGEVYAG